jgi:hypothetical protein
MSAALATGHGLAAGAADGDEAASAHIAAGHQAQRDAHNQQDGVPCAAAGADAPAGAAI